MTRSHPLDPALAQALAPEPAPQFLRNALLAEARRRDAKRRNRSRFLAAAASFILLASGAAGGYVVYSRSRPGASHSARLALQNFMEAHSLEFQGQDACAKACTTWSKSKLGFECPLPAACSGMRIVGGRASKLGGTAVAHFLLEGGRSLYVFREPLKGGMPAPGAPLAMAGGFQAKAWNEQGRGYVMVEQPNGK